MREANVLFFGNPWASGEIRGRQIAERGGWLFDPNDMRSGDIAVFIKSYPDDDFVLNARKAGISIWIDVIDCYGIVPFLQDFPAASVISISHAGVDYLKGKLNNNRVVYLPEHHCNFDMELRCSNKIKRAGFVGYECNFQLDPKVVKDALAHFGIEFVMLTEFKTRQDIVEFYKTIDVQIAFRVPGRVDMLVAELKNPLKLANAGSFGIPTIAYPEISYVDEWDGFFFPIGSMDGLIFWIDKMMEDWKVYEHMSAAALYRAKYYHIDNIVKKYREAFYGKAEADYNGGIYSIQLERKGYDEYLRKNLQGTSSSRSPRVPCETGAR